VAVLQGRNYLSEETAGFFLFYALLVNNVVKEFATTILEFPVNVKKKFFFIDLVVGLTWHTLARGTAHLRFP